MAFLKVSVSVFGPETQNICFHNCDLSFFAVDFCELVVLKDQTLSQSCPQESQIQLDIGKHQKQIHKVTQA